MEKIFITGGAGFLGSNLAESFLKDGIPVVVADDFSRSGSEYNYATLSKRFPALLSALRIDIEDMPAAIEKERPSAIFHFAAQVAVTTSVEDPELDFRINAYGTFLIAHAAHKLHIPLIYTSTNKVYGDNVNRVPLTELETRWEFAGDYFKNGLPESFSVDTGHHSPYGCSKHVGETYVREFGGVANRCSCMYGPYQHGIIDQGWLSFFILRKLRGEPVTIFGDGKQVRDGIHAHDVVALLRKQLAALIDSPEKYGGEVYNLGGGHENTTSLLELCARIDLEPIFADWRPADQKVFYCDITKAKETFEWAPTIALKDGLDELIEWSKKVVAET